MSGDFIGLFFLLFLLELIFNFNFLFFKSRKSVENFFAKFFFFAFPEVPSNIDPF